jgi:MraZ protein
LPESLIKKIGLKETAIFVGKWKTFEIWQPTKFTIYLAKAKASAKENRGQLKLVSSKKE